MLIFAVEFSLDCLAMRLNRAVHCSADFRMIEPDSRSGHLTELCLHVLETPYFGISNRKGEIVIPGVPVGRYVMKTWYETALPGILETMSREVNVTENSSTLGVLQVSARPDKTAHKNKYGMDYEPPAPDSPAYEQRQP